MKQFSLEEYLKNPNQKVVTRGGKEVRIICTDRKSAVGLPPILALIKSGEKDEKLLGFCTNGEYLYNGSAQKDKDLFFVSEKHMGWINIYKAVYNPIGGGVYGSKEEAERNIGLNRDYIATCKVEWEE